MRVPERCAVAVHHCQAQANQARWRSCAARCSYYHSAHIKSRGRVWARGPRSASVYVCIRGGVLLASSRRSLGACGMHAQARARRRTYGLAKPNSRNRKPPAGRSTPGGIEALVSLSPPGAECGLRVSGRPQRRHTARDVRPTCMWQSIMGACTVDGRGRDMTLACAARGQESGAGSQEPGARSESTARPGGPWPVLAARMDLADADDAEHWMHCAPRRAVASPSCTRCKTG